MTVRSNSDRSFTLAKLNSISFILKAPAAPAPQASSAHAGLRVSTAPFQPARAKVQLKLAIQRLRTQGAKKAQLAKVTRREIAGLLEQHKLERARIKVEFVMGEDEASELLEILELYCELLLARFGLLETPEREVDPGVAEAVAGVIHAALRTEVKEMHTLRDMLMSKYGRDFSIACMDNTDGCVSKRVTSKLSTTPPLPELVDLYLHEIAKAYSVDWQPEGYEDPAASAVPTALSLPTEAAPTLVAAGPPSTPSRDLSQFPSTPPVAPSAAHHTVTITTNLPTPAPVAPPAPLQTKSAASDQEAFDALTRRFAELKKR